MIDVPILVKDALRDGRRLKNYRILVLNDDGTTDFVIDNNTLVSETVDIDERMCSGDTIKFGLCEGSSLEFQYFNHPSIYGRQLQVFVDIQYMGNNGLDWSTIPMGFFTVEKCSRQASTGIKKVTAYNKLQSTFLDREANQDIIDMFGESPVYVMDINRTLLEGFGVETVEYYERRASVWGRYGVSDAKNSFTPFKYTTLNGDQGAFSPAIIKDNVSSFSTNTNVYISGFAQYIEIFANSSVEYMRVDFDDKVDEADKVIGEFYQRELNKISGNVSGDELWSRVRNMVGVQVPSSDDYGPSRYMNNYFFCAKITYTDNSVEYYGRYVRNPAGTFKELKQRTLKNVQIIQIFVPLSLRFGTTYGSDPYSYVNQQFIDSDNCINNVSSSGSSHPYKYYDTNGVEHLGHYEGPRYSDGSYIDINEIIQGFSALDITGGIEDGDLVLIDPTQIGKVTARELQSAVFEMNCQFGKLDRETDLFSGVDLNNSRLYPAEDLYPADNLYPDGSALSSEKSMYSKLWADEGNVQKWRNLIITYKGLDENNQEKDFTLERQINADGTQDYNMSDNWLFKNLVWTAAQIGDYADAMVTKMRDITWFPFEMWCAGLPYLETGDEIEISIGETTYTSYVLQRQLKGIQNLQDTYINGTLDIF